MANSEAVEKMPRSHSKWMHTSDRLYLIISVTLSMIHIAPPISDLLDMVACKDNSVVNIGSSVPHVARETGLVKRKLQLGPSCPVWHTEDVPRPEIFSLFSAKMGGIDKLAQLKKSKHRHMPGRVRVL